MRRNSPTAIPALQIHIAFRQLTEIAHLHDCIASLTNISLNPTKIVLDHLRWTLTGFQTLTLWKSCPLAINTTRRPRTCTASHTEEERRELWYQDDELGAMKREAKQIIANRKRVLANPDSTFAEREGMVGLERFSRQRATWKRIGIQYVLMAQRLVNMRNASNTDNKKHNYDLTQDFIRTAARRCTLWAQETATTQGFNDYLAVHDPLASLFSDEGKDKQDYNELIFGDTNNKDESIRSTRTRSSSSGGNKRKARLSIVCEPNEENERRVRHRTELPPIII